MRAGLEVFDYCLLLVLDDHRRLAYTGAFEVLKHVLEYGLPRKLYHALGAGICEGAQPFSLAGREHHRFAYCHGLGLH